MLFWKKKSKEQNLKDAFETAYLTLKRNSESDMVINGFDEKRSIIDIVSHYYSLSEEEAEEIYFKAVRQMDKEWREKYP